MGKGILIVILGSIALFGYISFNLNQNLGDTNSSAIRYYAESRTRDVGNSAAELLLSKLADDPKFRVKSPETMEIFGGRATYTVEKVSVDGDSLICVNVNSTYNGVTKNVKVHAAYSPAGWVPPIIRGAWTANGNLNNTISDMYIDGRNHGLDKSVIGSSGTYGVSTSVPFVNTQSAAVGGTYYIDGTIPLDYPMTYPENPKIIELYDWNGKFPTNPDEILGYTENTLRKIAQSEFGGSQFVTDIKDLTFPLKGVTFIQPSSANEFKLELLTINNTPNQGMLIVHRNNCTSKIKELKSSVPFVGIIITDYSFHHHLDVLGAVLQLSPKLELSKECKGNKDHWVYFSKDAIINATGIVAMYAEEQLGNNPNVNWKRCATAGMGLRRWGVIDWLE